MNYKLGKLYWVNSSQSLFKQEIFPHRYFSYVSNVKEGDLVLLLDVVQNYAAVGMHGTLLKVIHKENVGWIFDYGTLVEAIGT